MGAKSESISICICCNEPLACQTLKKAVSGWAKKRRVQFIVFHDPSSLSRCPQVYDILFLGTSFDSGRTGMDAARRLRAKGNNAQIIFYTGHIEPAVEGYEVEALGYLLKPLHTEKLHEALNTAVERLRGRHPALAICSEGVTVIMPVLSIVYIESVARRRIVHAKGQDVSTWETMQNLFDRLPSGDFAWVQKGVVVNLECVHKVRNNVVTLYNGVEFALSRNYKTDFHALLGRYTGAFPARATPARRPEFDANWSEERTSALPGGIQKVN